MGTWVCDSCTYINDEGVSPCEMCGAAPQTAASKQQAAQGWSCQACTVENEDAKQKCSVCGTHRPGCNPPAEQDVVILDDADDAEVTAKAPTSAAPSRKRKAEADLAEHNDEGNGVIKEPSGAQPVPAANPSAADSIYTLDSCSCTSSRTSLQDTIRKAASDAVANASVSPLTSTISGICCPNQHCRRLLSNRDASQLLGTTRLQHLYKAILQQATAETATATSAAPPPPTCTTCSETPMMPPQLPLVYTSGPSAGLPFNLSATRVALRKRGLVAQGSLQECSQRLIDHLVQQRVSHFCPTCTHQVVPQAASSSEEVSPEVSRAASACKELTAAVAALQKVQATGDVQEQQQGQGQEAAAAGAAAGEAAAGGGRGGRRRSSRHVAAAQAAGAATAAAAGGTSNGPAAAAAAVQAAAQAAAQVAAAAGAGAPTAYTSMADLAMSMGAGFPPHMMQAMAGMMPMQWMVADMASMGGMGGSGGSKGKKTWAAGTGYGGHTGGLTAKDKQAISAAAKKQDKADAAMTRQLANIRAILAGKHVAPRASAAMQVPVPLAVVAVVRAGMLPFCLRTLLQNDSLQDVSARRDLYMAALHLLRFMGSSMELVPALQQPAASPADPDPAAPSLLAVMQRLHTQCSIFKKSAEQLGEGDEEDIAALSLALEMSSMFEDLKADVDMYALAMGSQAQQEDEEPAAAAAPAAAQQSTPAAGGAGGRQDGKRRRGSDAALRKEQQKQEEEAQAKKEQEERAAANKAYTDVLQPLMFSEQPLERDHYFRQHASGKDGQVGGGEQMRQRLRRITQEIGTLSTSLPLTRDSSVLLAVDQDKLDMLRACFFPAADTPYGNGAFMFDIWLPPSYPTSPPKVQFLTTGGGTVRFNPNLYNCGKVCLSLLGTWSGPSWQPGISTLLQVLISIQSMIFVCDPYFNEPGHESMMRTSGGQASSRQYNQSLRYNTMRFAVLQQLRSPPPAFADAIKAHFRLKRAKVEAQCEGWCNEADGSHKKPMKQLVDQIKEELARL